jgi:hypothetical protein
MKRMILNFAVLVLIASCATKVKGLKQSSSFNIANIQSAKFAVGGTIHFDKGYSPKMNKRAGSSLRNMFIEERSDLKINSVGQTMSKIGKKTYKNMMNAYMESGELTTKHLNILKKKLKGYRYVIFKSIENDNTEKLHFNEMKKDENNQDTDRVKYVVAQVTRTVDANVAIYDLVEGNKAWSGTIRKGDQKRKKHSPKIAGGLINLVKAVRGDEISQEKDYPFPKTPKMTRIMEQVYAGMLENFPEAD